MRYIVALASIAQTLRLAALLEEAGQPPGWTRGPAEAQIMDISADLQLEPGEVLLADERFVASKKSVPFRMAVTDRAVFLTRLNRTSLKQPWYLERIGLERVRTVSLVPVRPYKAWAAAVFFVALGIFTLVAMFIQEEGGTLSGWPLALTIGGIVIPFVVPGRKELKVQLADELYRWRPEIIVDRKSRAETSRVQNILVHACRQAGIAVDRSSAEELRLSGGR